MFAFFSFFEGKGLWWGSQSGRIYVDLFTGVAVLTGLSGIKDDDGSPP